MKKAKILGKIILLGLTILIILMGLYFMGMAIYKSVTSTEKPTSPIALLDYYKDRCADNEIDHCYEVGVRYIKGIGTKQSFKNASVYFGKACKLGDKESCQKEKLSGLMGKMEHIEDKPMNEMSESEIGVYQDTMRTMMEIRGE